VLGLFLEELGLELNDFLFEGEFLGE